MNRRTLADDAAFAGDRQFATTLARGMAILRCFTPERPLLTNKALCELLALPKATVSRLTYTLCMLGVLRCDPASAAYGLGSSVLAIGYPLLANLPLRQTAKASMMELARSVHGSVSMAIRDRLNMVFVEVSRSATAESSHIADVGMSYPIVSTAMGRAYFASCGAAEQDSLTHEILLGQPRDWDRHRNGFEASVPDLRTLGFCMTYGELRPEIAAVAAPYAGSWQGCRLVFNCVVSTARFSRERLRREVGPRLSSMLRDLSATP